MSARLAGKVALITGTAGGQGRAAALLFAAEGARVVGCDVQAAAADETVELVHRAGGLMESSHPLDLTDERAVSGWVDEAAQRHGRIDILYANAAATRFAPLEDITGEDWDWVLRSELDVVLWPVKHAWRHLKRSPAAAVVLVGSTAGLRGSMTNARVMHTVTKGGIIALTRQLAAEGAPYGIRANCVSPGMIETPATRADLLAEDHPMRGIARHIPLGRIGSAEEVARCSLFLASDDASYVTGANLVVDGGWSAVLPGLQQVLGGRELQRNGARVAVLLGADDYDSLLETVEILSDSEALEAIRTGLGEAGAGEMVGVDEVREEMVRAGRLPG